MVNIEYCSNEVGLTEYIDLNVAVLINKVGAPDRSFDLYNETYKIGLLMNHSEKRIFIKIFIEHLHYLDAENLLSL